MAEKQEKKPRVKGFAGMISKQLDSLNRNDKFKHVFRDVSKKILLNANDAKYAALIKIEKGTLIVEGVENDSKAKLKKKVVGWNGFLSTSTNLLLDAAIGKLPLWKMGIKVLTRKIRVRGIRSLLLLQKMFTILSQAISPAPSPPSKPA